MEDYTKMKRRDILKGAGLVGIISTINPKRLSSKIENKENLYGLQDLYGDDFIKKVVTLYKKERPIFRVGSSSWDSEDSRVAFLDLEGGFYIKYYIDEIIRHLVIIDNHKQCDNKHCATISRNKQGLYSVRSEDGHVEYREENGGFLFSTWGGKAIIPLPRDNRKFFEPYKELYELVLQDRGDN